MDLVSLLMEAIIAQLELYIEQNEEESGYPYRQPYDLYYRKPFVSNNISERYDQIISKHGNIPVDFIFHKPRNGPENLKQVPRPS
jgi:hypothetical protein